MLWVDKYRPTDLKKMDYHADLSSRLVELAKDGDLPHLLFYGPSGAGKKTRIAALLKALYGTGAAKQRLEYREFKTPTNKLIEVTTVASNYHIEMNPGDAGNNDRFVVQEVIKEIAQSASLHAKTGRVAYKVILLVEVDRLTRQAQAALRRTLQRLFGRTPVSLEERPSRCRTMEKCTSSCRLILCCNNPSKVIDPLRSRCLGIRVGAPTEAEIVSVLHSVADKEGVQLPVPLAARIASQSKRNLRRAILSLEACHAQSYPFSPEQAIDAPDWETYIVSMANDILREQSPQSPRRVLCLFPSLFTRRPVERRPVDARCRRLLATREKLYELLVKCIPADVIIKTLTRELLKNLDDELKTEVLHWAAVYEHRIQLGSKEIFHLEAFVAKFMALYKRFIVSMFD